MQEIPFGALRLRISPTVYEPAEDSFMLATYASSLSGKVLEIGIGSGIAALSAAYANRKNDVIGVDINPAAVKCARENAKLNKITNAIFRESDLFSDVSGKFDTVLFNPPYLPTTRAEKLVLERENAAYDGGEPGLEVFRKFSHEAANHMFLGGRTAVIATSLGDGIRKTVDELEERIGPAQILMEEAFFFEKIALVEATLK